MSDALIGFWRVQSIDMSVGPVVSLIGGLPGECVEFTEDGYYHVNIARSRPNNYFYRTASYEGFSTLDTWIKGLESLVARCIYKIDGQTLTVCVGGNYGERPTDFRRDDSQLWCLIKMERTNLQKRELRSRHQKNS